MFTRTQSRFHSFRLRLEHHVPSSRTNARVWEFLLFVFKQGWACLFGGTILALVLLTKAFYPAHAPLARYDFLFLAALTVQLLLLALRMETVREAKVILLFHLVGTGMEVFKTSVGSWAYPGLAEGGRIIFRIAQVPLFSGFMYSSVGSYIARGTRIVEMRYTHYPPRWATIALAVLIYANFFTHHFLPDIRLLLFGLVAVLYGRTWVYYKPYLKFRRMPLLLGFALVALFLWIAENIGTFAKIWIYPHQHGGWHIVPVGKYGAWFLLMIISFILVSLVHPPRVPEPASESAPGSAPGSAKMPAAEAVLSRSGR